ncbi:MAG: polysaccharide biosynthesis tyrosine autokinase, partial [Bacteroidota bacterium]
GDAYFMADFNTGEAFEVEREIKYEGEFKYGAFCESEFFKVQLDKIEGVSLIPEEGKPTTYHFYLNTLQGLTDIYRGRVDIGLVGEESSILGLNMEGPTPGKDVEFLDALCNTYIQKKLEKKNNLAASTIDFINQELSLVEDSLNVAQNELIDIQRRSQSMNAQFTATEASRQQQTLMTQKAQLEVEYQYLQDLLSNLESDAGLDAIVAPTTVGVSNVQLNTLVSELQGLASEKISKEAVFGEESQDMRILNGQIENKRRSVIKNVAQVIKGTELKLNSINSQLANVRGEIARLPTAQAKVAQASRRIDITESLYNYLMQKRYEAGISMAANKPDSRILDVARVTSRQPIAPKKGVIMATFFMMGLFFPAIIIIVMDLFDNRVKTEEQLTDATGISVLSSVMHSEDNKDIYDADFILSPLAESFRYLKVNLDYVSVPDRTNVIGVTSMVQGEGKTFTASHLAAVLALSGKKTLIVGADIRRPALYKRMGVEKDEGLSLYLVSNMDIESVVQRTRIKNLHVIPSGMPPPNPSELLSSGKLGEFFEQVKSMYDVVVVDTPPVGLVSDYLILAKYIDTNLFVVRQGYSRKEFLSETRKLREDNGLKKAFFVFNDVKDYSGKKYSGKYGQRYTYGMDKNYNKNTKYPTTKKLWDKIKTS